MVNRPKPPSVDRLRRAAAGCRDCPLWAHATQTVFGEGNPRARLMLVGEQPGDVEDRDIRAVLFREAYRLPAITRLGDHCPVGILLQHPAQALANQGVIVGEQDAEPHG